MTPIIRYIPLGRGHFLRANSIYAIIRPDTKQAKRSVSIAKKAGKYLNFANSNPVKSILLLDDDRVVGCMYKATTIYSRILAVTGQFIDALPAADMQSGVNDEFLEAYRNFVATNSGMEDINDDDVEDDDEYPETDDEPEDEEVEEENDF